MTSTTQSRPIVDRQPRRDDRMPLSRRRFLGVLGGGAVGGAALPRGASAQEIPVVRMGNNYFDPVGLAVEPGTTVRFEIEAGTHSATAYPERIPGDATAFDSGVIDSGSFDHTFQTPGTYDYYCIPHRGVGMVARIVVGEPGGPAEDSPIPDGSVPESRTIVERGAVGSTEGDDGGSAGGSGMGGPGMGSGMMGGRSGGWWGVLPAVGGILGVLAVGAATLYWAGRRGSAAEPGTDAAVATLESRYARGEIDEETYRRRRERLTSAPDERGDPPVDEH